MTNEVIELIAQMFTIASRLTELTSRPFTLDGLMIGSIGEVYAQQYYEIVLYPNNRARHDGTWNKREVQIKATQGTGVNLTCAYDLLLVLKIAANGSFEEIYNGDGKRPWQAQEHLTRNRADYRRISLTQLERLNSQVNPADRIPRKK